MKKKQPNKLDYYSEAKQWWNTKGRDLLRHRQYSAQPEARYNQENLDALNPLHPNFIGGFSGILQGLHWNDLSPDERNRIVAVYMNQMLSLISNMYDYN